MGAEAAVFCLSPCRSAASFNGGMRRRSPAAKSLAARATGGHRPHPAAARTMVCPEPPWLVVPPCPPQNPFAGQAWMSDIEMKKAGRTEIPLSLRMVQRKKRLAGAAPVWTGSPLEAEWGNAVEGPMGRAVSALVLMSAELQRSAMVNGDGRAADETVLDRVSKDRRDCLVWLLRGVFFSSPDFVAALLVLLADYGAATAERLFTAAATAVLERKDDGPPMPSAGSAPGGMSTFLNWFDIGIEEGKLQPRQRAEETSVDRRRRMYERAIAEGGASSLILCNYAQFLYRVEHDPHRAEQYFRWATMAEPRDAEAISRYAFFLWEERGDLEAAEEMFLEAIEAEPGNHHNSSTYAWFLWNTGALDTCYPLEPPAAASG